jgi:branched-subunit amino acid transport protein
METTTIWLVILGGMVVTYATRLSFTVILPADQLPRQVQQALRFAPPAVLAAIAIPSIILPGSAKAIQLTHPQTLAGLAAALIAWRTGSTWLTIAVGLVLLWLLQQAGL